MLFHDAVFIGIDPSAGKRPIRYAALDSKRRMIVHEQGDIEQVLAFLASLETAVVAIDAPQALNQGWMRKPEIRRSLGLPPGGRTWTQWRVCEYELRQHNIRLYNTPDRLANTKNWVQVGITLFRRARDMGYRLFRKGESSTQRMLIEARAHVGYTAILKRRPFSKESLEGRLQRQLLLFVEGLDVPNPLHALEEVTRHHLLSGHLPLGDLRDHETLDTLMAAYCAYLTAMEPDRVSQVGEAEESLITLPVPELLDNYP
jgi:predicted nuclease with RNAse H fold